MTGLADLPFAKVACALCGVDEPRSVATVDRFAVELRIVRCGGCGHVYLSPRPADSSLCELYDEEYYAGEGDYGYADDRETPAIAGLRAAARLAPIERLTPSRTLLEVGCSFGAFLLAARGRGWKVAGVDLSPVAAGACREAGLDVTEGTLEEAGLPSERFGVVYLSETVEHLPDPRATVRAAAQVLERGGLLVLGTANHASVARVLRGRRWGYYMPGHLQYFTAASLTRLLREEGFAIVRRRFGDDRSLADLRRIRRAEGRAAGPFPMAKEALLRWHCGGRSVGAGMVLYGRKV